ncbi:MAG: BlaI/MecI/CopY family transcriptional regulator [Clostridiales bacterium]|nr:BlaI/MecI/CopY family transcriptional regulator [Clostridiales bacterium]MDY6067417.1 BlaI/MecI/CopY family transcriptional regulator [Candidatus Faecousia sp.]
MEERKLGPVELRFAELIWENAPISSGELVKLCARELEWKKSTTYTVLKKLCEQGLFQNQGGTVTVLVSRQDYQARQSKQFVADTFSGSLPAFLAAFAQGAPLSQKDIADIRALIDRFEQEGQT